MMTQFIDSIKRSFGDPHALAAIYNLICNLEQQQWREILDDGITNWTQKFVQQAKKNPTATVIIESESGKHITYGDLDRFSLSIAEYIEGRTSDKYIGVYDGNSAGLIAAIIGVNRAGRTAVLFNVLDPVERVVTLAQSCDVKLILGRPVEGFNTIPIDMDLLGAFNPTDRARDAENISGKFKDEGGSLSDPAFVIFTSGTSGVSKPALFSHKRMLGAGIAWSIRTGMSESDRCYICLPLCHGNGLAMAFSSVVTAGACAVIRERFSVSRFWDDININNCTHMVYIGELWRYLLNRSAEKTISSSLRVIFGNGLSRPIWQQVIERFGIEHVVEHYGATEMPASALTNWTGHPGACGFIPPTHEDHEGVMMVDDELLPTKVDEPGEILLKIPDGQKYLGYLTPDLNDAKVVTLTDGTSWWRSGDTLIRDDHGYFYFHERLGDNYRYKGENISAIDVERAIIKCAQVAEACVYGVRLPNFDGSLGMASILPMDRQVPIAESEKWLNDLLAGLRSMLATHAIPHLIRVTREPHQITTTLKIVKTQLKQTGISLWSSEPHFVLTEGRYARIDLDLFGQLMSGELKLGF